MQQITYILFDFFGVLSSPVYKKVIDTFVPELDRQTWVEKLDELDRGTLTEDDLVSGLADAAEVPQGTIRKAADDASVLNEELFEYIESTLKNKVKVGLFTNIPRNILERLISHKLSLFELQIVSSDFQLIKPDKRIFEVAIREADALPEEILFTDDKDENVDIAKSLGMNAFVYKDFESCKEQIAIHL